MVRIVWVVILLCCFAACAALVLDCTATDRAAVIDAAKSACVVIDHVPTNASLYVFVRPLADGGAE